MSAPLIDWSLAPAQATAWKFYPAVLNDNGQVRFPATAYWLSTHPWFDPQTLGFAPTFGLDDDSRSLFIVEREDQTLGALRAQDSLKAGIVPRMQLRLLPAPYECARAVIVDDRLVMYAAGEPPAYLNDDGSIEIVIPRKETGK